MVLLLFLRRLGPRARMIAGAVLAASGLVVVAASAVAGGLLVHGIALTAIGAAVCASVGVGGRRARRTALDEGTARGR